MKTSFINALISALMLLVLAGIGFAGAAAARRWNAEKP